MREPLSRVDALLPAEIAQRAEEVGVKKAALDTASLLALAVLALGLLAFILDTVAGLLFGKLMYAVTGGKINPLIGAAGISAFPMAARVVQKVGSQYNKKSYLLMHAMGANAGGQIGSVIAAAVMLSVLAGMGVIR